MSTVLESLNRALHDSMQADERVYLLGEDVLDPYGGAFKVTRGLSSAFPSRVLTTPISEAGITGVAGGMALRGLRPVVEIMFGDFITLTADQLINSLSKFRWMYNDDSVTLPLVVRAPMGGRRGYGATHSQTLEKLFLGVPGLRVLAPTAVGDPRDLLRRAVLDDDQPVLFVENKLLYLQRLHSPASLSEFTLLRHDLPGTYAPAYTLTIQGAPPPAITLAAYGYMSELARQAMHRLAFEHEVFCELVVLTQLAPLDAEPRLPAPLLASIERTHNVLAVEEGSLTLGWGAEILARSAEALGRDLHCARRLAAAEHPIPASVALEAAALPDVADIVRAAVEMVEGTR